MKIGKWFVAIGQSSVYAGQPAGFGFHLDLFPFVKGKVLGWKSKEGFYWIW
jgi:hypothetical protein